MDLPTITKDHLSAGYYITASFNSILRSRNQSAPCLCHHIWRFQLHLKATYGGDHSTQQLSSCETLADAATWTMPEAHKAVVAMWTITSQSLKNLQLIEKVSFAVSSS
jgi:hypothetical protein